MFSPKYGLAGLEHIWPFLLPFPVPLCFSSNKKAASYRRRGVGALKAPDDPLRQRYGDQGITPEIQIMNRTLLALMLALCSVASSQVVYPYNPDVEPDGFIGINDLLGFLPEFGSEFSVDSTSWTADILDALEALNNEISMLELSIDSLEQAMAPSEWNCGMPIEFEGYSYNTVQIGPQCWFAEELRYAPIVYPSSDWSTSEPRFYLAEWNSAWGNTAISIDSLSDNQWIYFNTVALRELDLCPQGWKVPSAYDYLSLFSSIARRWEPLSTPTFFTPRDLLDTDEWSEVTPQWSQYGFWDNGTEFSIVPTGFVYNGNSSASNTEYAYLGLSSGGRIKVQPTQTYVYPNGWLDDWSYTSRCILKPQSQQSQVNLSVGFSGIESQVAAMQEELSNLQGLLDITLTSLQQDTSSFNAHFVFDPPNGNYAQSQEVEVQIARVIIVTAEAYEPLSNPHATLILPSLEIPNGYRTTVVNAGAPLDLDAVTNPSTNEDFRVDHGMAAEFIFWNGAWYPEH